jgi:hypothetical protein
MRSVSGKGCREYKNTFYVQWLFYENCAIYENVEKLVEPDRPQMTISYGAEKIQEYRPDTHS